MNCQCCTVAIDHPTWYMFYPPCKYCTARNLKMLDAMTAIDTEARRERKTAVLKDAIKHGHDEQMVRDLHKAGPWIEPQARPIEKPKAKRK